MAITTEWELKSQIQSKLVKVVEYLMLQILKENNKIMREAFLTRRQNATVYQHTDEFFNAWDYKAEIKQKVHGEFYYSPTEEYATHDGRYMATSEPPNASNDFMGQHHGIGGIWGDSREYLADLLYLGIRRSIYNGGKRVAGINAFNSLVKAVGKRKFATWVNEGFKRNGISYHFHSYPVVSNK